MTETWLSLAIKRPGSIEKIGYSGVKYRPLSEIEGEVKHSTEGGLSAAFGQLDLLSRQASWHFTIDLDGTIYQHYPLEAICWHCGLPGDRRQDTSLIGNYTLIGEEHVDRTASGLELPLLTLPQRESSARLSVATREVAPSYAARPPTLRTNLWEHNWLSATACPSGLIPWAPIITRINELEEDMSTENPTLVEIRDMVIAVLRAEEFNVDRINEIAAKVDALAAAPPGTLSSVQIAAIATSVSNKVLADIKTQWGK